MESAGAIVFLGFALASQEAVHHRFDPRQRRVIAVQARADETHGTVELTRMGDLDEREAGTLHADESKRGKQSQSREPSRQTSPAPCVSLISAQSSSGDDPGEDAPWREADALAASSITGSLPSPPR